MGQLTIIEEVQNKEKHNTTRADAARRVMLIGMIVITVVVPAALPRSTWYCLLVDKVRIVLVRIILYISEGLLLATFVQTTTHSKRFGRCSVHICYVIISNNSNNWPQPKNTRYLQSQRPLSGVMKGWMSWGQAIIINRHNPIWKFRLWFSLSNLGPGRRSPSTRRIALETKSRTWVNVSG